MAAYTFRFNNNYGLRAFGGVQLFKFEKPDKGSIESGFDSLSTFGLEFLKSTGPISKIGFFIMQQDHPLYRAITPTTFETFKLKFAQAGLSFYVGQRRRIGLLWGAGLKGFVLFPTAGGSVATETGVGGEAHARLGWVGPLGTLHQIKGFYQASTAPNAAVNFTHTVLGYCYRVSYSF